jgi:hypothetical protein
MLSALTQFGNIILEHSKLVLAFLVGSLGSAAYITALYYKFIGDNDENRSIIIKPFCNPYSNYIDGRKCIWYCAVGGCIAVVFQFDVPTFVAVQSLILGATWPAIVSQFLSGRMAAPSPKELDSLSKPRSPKMDKTLLDQFKEISKKFKD